MNIKTLNQNLQGLLGSPMFNMGVGLLAAGGRRPGPKISFGQGLAEASQYASSRERQQMELEAKRQAVQQQQNQQKAMTQLQGLLSQPNAASVPPMIRRPGAIQNQQNQLQGLLAQLNPQQFTSSLIQQQFAQPQQQRLPSSVQEAMAVSGLQPGQPGFEEAFQRLQNPANPSQQLADTLAAQQIQANLRQQENAQLEQSRQARRRSTGASNSVSEISGIIDLMEQAEGTAAQPGYLAQLIGGGASLKAGLSNLFGSTDEGAEKTAEIIQKMGKSFTRLSTSTIPDAFLGSDSKLRFFQSQLPSVDLQLGTNMSIMESYLQGLIDEDYVDDGELNTSQEAVKLLERIKRIKSAGSASQTGSVPPPPPGFVMETAQ